MAASITTPSTVTLPAERYFLTSFYLLIDTAVATLASPGKLHVITMIVEPTAVQCK
jgi:hypothetical protein